MFFTHKVERFTRIKYCIIKYRSMRAVNKISVKSQSTEINPPILLTWCEKGRWCRGSYPTWRCYLRCSPSPCLLESPSRGRLPHSSRTGVLYCTRTRTQHNTWQSFRYSWHYSALNCNIFKLTEYGVEYFSNEVHADLKFGMNWMFTVCAQLLTLSQ